MRRHPTSRRLPPALFALALLVAYGCTGAGTTESTGVTIDLALRPDPPKVGKAAAVITLTDKAGRPVRGAAVKLEGNMNHAGMTPVFADAKEVEPGRYETELEFTMGGDWFVLVNVTLPDGRKLTRKVDVRGVTRGE
jgi:YtkA-like